MSLSGSSSHDDHLNGGDSYCESDSDGSGTDASSVSSNAYHPQRDSWIDPEEYRAATQTFGEAQRVGKTRANAIEMKRKRRRPAPDLGNSSHSGESGQDTEQDATSFAISLMSNWLDFKLRPLSDALPTANKVRSEASNSRPTTLANESIFSAVRPTAGEAFNLANMYGAQIPEGLTPKQYWNQLVAGSRFDDPPGTSRRAWRTDLAKSRPRKDTHRSNVPFSKAPPSSDGHLSQEEVPVGSARSYSTNDDGAVPPHLRPDQPDQLQASPAEQRYLEYQADRAAKQYASLVKAGLARRRSKYGSEEGNGPWRAIDQSHA